MIIAGKKDLQDIAVAQIAAAIYIDSELDYPLSTPDDAKITAAVAKARKILKAVTG